MAIAPLSTPSNREHKINVPTISQSVQFLFLIKAELAGVWHGDVSVWLMSAGLGRSRGQTVIRSLCNQLF